MPPLVIGLLNDQLSSIAYDKYPITQKSVLQGMPTLPG